MPKAPKMRVAGQPKMTGMRVPSIPPMMAP